MTESERAKPELFSVWHFQIGADQQGDPEDDWVQPKEIGNYTTKEKALAAIERARHLEGFCDWPNGFRVFVDHLDRVGWPDGISDQDMSITYWSYRSVS